MKSPVTKTELDAIRTLAWVLEWKRDAGGPVPTPPDPFPPLPHCYATK